MAVKKESQERAQELMTQIKTLESHMKKLHEQSQIVEQQLMELTVTDKSIDAFSGVEKGQEMLVQLSSGVFVKTVVDDPSKVLINVGSDVVVEKDPEGAQKLVSEQLEHLKRIRAQMQAEFEKLGEIAQKYQSELKKLVSED